jgi:hypothetical protein
MLGHVRSGYARLGQVLSLCLVSSCYVILGLVN